MAHESVCRICMVEFERVASSVSRATSDEGARLDGTPEQCLWLRQVLRDWQQNVKVDAVCQRGERYHEDVFARFGVLLAHLGVAAGALDAEHVDLWSSGFLPSVKP